MSNTFKLFALSPVFKKHVKFLQQDRLLFKNKEGQPVAFSHKEFFFFAVLNDPEPTFFKYSSLDRNSFCKAYLKDFYIIFKDGEPRMKILMANVLNGFKEIEDLLNSIADEMYTKYYRPLILAEENGITAIQIPISNIDPINIDSTSFNLAIEKLNTLDKIRYALNLLSEGADAPLQPIAYKYLLYLSFYGTEATIEKVNDQWNILITLNIQDNTPREEVESLLTEFINGPLSSKVIAIITTGLKIVIEKPISSRGKSKGDKLKRLDRNNGTFVVSGHSVDQTLKSKQPKPGEQLALELSKTTVEKIGRLTGQSTSEAMEWINSRGERWELNAAQFKVLFSVTEILYEKSQTVNPNKEDYYTGNVNPEVILYGGQEMISPKLSVTLYEVAKKYKGNEHVSGKDIKTVSDILWNLSEDPARRALIRYNSTVKTGKGTRVDIIEEFQPLVKVAGWETSHFDEKLVLTSRTKQVLITLNPVYRHSIADKFLRLPTMSRMIKAAGTHSISAVTFMLINYLAREHSSNRMEPEIGLTKLYWIIAEDYMKQSKIYRVKEYFADAVETLKNLGLLDSFKIMPALNGEDKVVFTLNKKW